MKLAHNRDSLTLTPNRRLAATLHKQYIDSQTSECWHTPNILPINTWLEQLWLKQQLDPKSSKVTLLNPNQEQYLWEQSIAKSEHGDTLLRLSETAGKAKQAYMLATQWKLDLNHSAFEQNIDCQYFKHWLTLFRKKCQELKAIDSNLLTIQLIELIKSKQLPLASRINLVGFTDLSPLQHDLIDALTSSNCQIHKTDYLKENNQSKARCTALGDSEAEIFAMARWAKHIYEDNDNATAACVIPNLDKQRDRILQIFCEVFAEDKHNEIEIKNLPFNISAGKRLTQYPAINIALNLLKLSGKQVLRENFSYLLCSPFIGDAENEKLQRYQLDITLRKLNQHQFNLENILHSHNAIGQAFNRCQKLEKRMVDFYQQLNSDKKNLYQWSLHFNHLLLLLGWPGERSLNSEEYQTIDAWMKLLHDFATIDIRNTDVTLNEALHLLNQLASKTIFQPESPESNIQILGILEAASLPFDHVWLCGMDDYNWPNQASANPFLPKTLQVQAGVPHASAERELYYCQQLINQFRNNANDVIFSYAEKNDGISQHLSPLLLNLEITPYSNISLSCFSKAQNEVFASSQLQSIIDNAATSASNESTQTGGSDILKLQALCPFRAFATHRLHARPMDKTQPGLLARDRGKIAHKILEIFWKKIKTLNKLKSLSHEELDRTISSIINDSISIFSRHYILNNKYIDLEKQRLKRMITSWLDIEKERDEFEVIASEEKSTLALGKLTINLIIDRIDSIENHQHLIIDYKTSKNNSISSWFGPRPEEPQLPIYALINEEKTIGISFAQIATNSMKFQGLSNTTTNIKGIKPIQQALKSEDINWQKQLNEWRSTFEKLSDDFCHGEAIVDPKETTTCHYCQLSTFCRINETNTQVQHDE